MAYFLIVFLQHCLYGVLFSKLPAFVFPFLNYNHFISSVLLLNFTALLKPDTSELLVPSVAIFYSSMLENVIFFEFLSFWNINQSQ